jgi:carbon dioxide concentrating mechanism protein CcmO
MQEAERIGELHAVMIIPRLLEDLEHTLPVATYWLDENEPLPMLLPNTVREKQRQLIALPELEKAVIPQRIAEPLPQEDSLPRPLPESNSLEAAIEHPTVEVLKPEEF